MTQTRFLTAAAALVLLGACATATPYQAALDSQRGYTDTQIESNRWQVTFSGNSLTDRQTVETYLLYRAAELTDQNGFDYFQIVDSDTDANRRYISTGGYYAGYPLHYRFYGRRGRLRGYPIGFYRGFGYDPFLDNRFDVREVVRFEAIAEIVAGQGEKPEGAAYYNADEVLMNLSTKIQRPAP